MDTKPENPSMHRSGHESKDSNPLLLAILAAVIIGSILVTVFTVTRLVTKRLTSAYDLDDCECHMIALAVANWLT